MIEVSAALKTVTVANPSGFELEESVIFPFNVPWLHNKGENKQAAKAESIVFFMCVGYGYTKRIYTILLVLRIQNGRFKLFFV